MKSVREMTTEELTSLVTRACAAFDGVAAVGELVLRLREAEADRDMLRNLREIAQMVADHEGDLPHPDGCLEALREFLDAHSAALDAALRRTP